MSTQKNKYKLVALLPMKANSERVVGKNFRTFAGKPLFRWILESLLEIEEIEKVIINTDARKILSSHGLVESDRIEIRDRKESLCGDFVSMNEIIRDDINCVPADTYMMTHTTNPLLTSRTVIKALEYYEASISKGFDSLFTVNKYQTRFYKEDCSPVNHNPNELIRTQDLEAYFEENSNLYIFNSKSFSSSNARIGLKPVMYSTPRMESFDIDDEIGWTLAELVALTRQISKAHSNHE